MREEFVLGWDGLAEGEYEKYRVVQDKLHESDFDELIKAGEKITTTKTSL